MINVIDHIVKYIIGMGQNFMSSESVKNIACVRQKINKLGKRSLYLTAKTKHEAQFGLLVLKGF